MLPPLVSPPRPPKIEYPDFVSVFDQDMKKMMEERKPEVVYLNIYNENKIYLVRTNSSNFWDSVSIIPRLSFISMNSHMVAMTTTVQG